MSHNSLSSSAVLLGRYGFSCLESPASGWWQVIMELVILKCISKQDFHYAPWKPAAMCLCLFVRRACAMQRAATCMGKDIFLTHLLKPPQGLVLVAQDCWCHMVHWEGCTRINIWIRVSRESEMTLSLSVGFEVVASSGDLLSDNGWLSNDTNTHI